VKLYWFYSPEFHFFSNVFH